MDLLERLERSKGGPFTYRVNGQVRGLPSPADIDPLELLEILHLGDFTVRFGLPSMALWRTDLLFAAWCAHFDLPDAQSARRLYYLVERYGRDLEYDLQGLGVDLGEAWRSRRWRWLLNIVDHLPNHTYFAEAVSNDEEHAEMLAKAEAAQTKGAKDRPAWTPPLRTWTPEVDVLTRVLDAVNALKYVTIAANSEKGKAPRPPEPAPRPKTAIERARARADYQRRLRKHESLVARVLPKKAAPPAPPPPGPGTEFLRRKAGLVPSRDGATTS